MRKNCFSYPVEFVTDAFGESPVLADTLKRVSTSGSPRVLIVADMNVVQRTEGLGSKIGRYVQTHGIALAGSPVVLSGGEKVKADGLQGALGIFAAMLSAPLGRNDVVLALGGGTILDVAGYAAAQVQGGARLVRVPTTPAAMLDAAYADYAAVDSAKVKDALRVPSVPSAVVIDTAFAKTVLDGVWRGGIGEAVRFAAGTDAALLKKVARLIPACHARDAQAFEELVRAVGDVRAKRPATTLGLWGAFRLATMSGYKLPHGYATGIGVWLDFHYAAERGLCTAKDRDLVCDLLFACGTLEGLLHSRHLVGQADRLLRGLDAWALAAGHDRVVFPSGLGKTVEEVPDRDVFRRVVSESLPLSPRP